MPERASLATKPRWVETLEILRQWRTARSVVATRSFRPGHPLP
jgi:hypothetical protein